LLLPQSGLARRNGHCTHAANEVVLHCYRGVEVSLEGVGGYRCGQDAGVAFDESGDASVCADEVGEREGEFVDELAGRDGWFLCDDGIGPAAGAIVAAAAASVPCFAAAIVESGVDGALFDGGGGGADLFVEAVELGLEVVCTLLEEVDLDEGAVDVSGGRRFRCCGCM
jgi:hypothetical protein